MRKNRKSPAKESTEKGASVPNEETQKILDRIQNGFCAVLGAGISNRPLLGFLQMYGAKVIVRDRKPEEQLEQRDALLSCGATLICGDNYLETLDSFTPPEQTVIFRSPGLRPDSPDIQRAVQKGAILTSEMELFLALTPATVIAVTGSDGKTTTTTLIGKLLEAGRKDSGGRVYVGGNIGCPLLPEARHMTEKDFAVVELSSFQLQTMHRSPAHAVITNITPNHLNWHTDMAEYTEAKYNIFQHPGCRALTVNADNEGSLRAGLLAAAHSKAQTPECVPHLTFFSLTKGSYETVVPKEAAGALAVFEREGQIILSEGDRETEIPVLRTEEIKVRGRHNVANYMAAFAATRAFVLPSALPQVAHSFGGVAHRIELVREKDGVSYYNSSIDSTPARTAVTLASFEQKAIVICGGYDKNLPFEPLAETLCRRAKQVVLTGACAGKILSALHACPAYEPGRLALCVEPDFEKAVRIACRDTRPGDAVILSPACASFDAFRNFEERGEKFKEIVQSL